MGKYLRSGKGLLGAATFNLLQQATSKELNIREDYIALNEDLPRATQAKFISDSTCNLENGSHRP